MRFLSQVHSRPVFFVLPSAGTTVTITIETTTSTLSTSTTSSNITTTSASSIYQVAYYSFDNQTDNLMGNYDAGGILPPVYVAGWVGNAINFSHFDKQYLSTAHIPLNLRSFTIEFWFYATNLTSTWDYSFGGQNHSQSGNRRLFFNIRYRALALGFYANDLVGTTILSIKRWYHAAFVYDNATQR